MTVSPEEIADLVGLQLGLEGVSPQARIIEDLGAESADVMNIVAAVEDKYGVSIAEETIPDIRTVLDLHRTVAG